MLSQFFVDRTSLFLDFFDRNFDGFRKRYFSPDTDYTCALKSNGKHQCQVRGSLKLAALRTDLRKIIKSTEKKLSN